MLKKMIICLLILVSAMAYGKVVPVTAVNKTFDNSVKDGVWFDQNTNFSNNSRGIKFIDAVDDNVVWATVYDGADTDNTIQELCKTIDGGETWTEIVLSGFEDVAPAMINGIDANRAYVAIYTEGGEGQGIYYTKDGGVVWTRQDSAFPTDDSFVNIVHFFNENDGFCQGDPIDGFFEIYTTTDGGDSWIRVPDTNIPVAQTSEWGMVGYYDTIGNNIWFGTNKGRVYKSANKGLNWEVSETTLTGKYVDVTFSDNMNGLAMNQSNGSTGELSKTVDGGLTWVDVVPEGNVYTNDFEAVPGVSGVYVTTGAATDFSGASYSLDGGLSWTDFAGMTGKQALACDFVSNNRGWAGAFNNEAMGGMYRYDGQVMGIDEGISIPSVVSLENNYPNPFNPSTKISFALKAEANVNLSVFDVSGRKVSELISLKMAKGEHSVDFNASNLAAGVYYYSINANGFTVTKKMVLAK